MFVLSALVFSRIAGTGIAGIGIGAFHGGVWVCSGLISRLREEGGENQTGSNTYRFFHDNSSSVIGN